MNRPTRLASARLIALLAVGFFVSCGNKADREDREVIEYGSGYDRCAAGDYDGCVEHADAVLGSKSSLARRSALVAYQFGCIHDHPGSCAGLARLLGDADGGRQRARLMEALVTACDGGEMSACVDLAQTKPSTEATPLYRKACDGGEGRGCHQLAEQMRKKFRFASQMGEALALDERACELGAVEGCVASGQAYLFGSGVEQDTPRGLELLNRGCTADVGTSCATLANIYEQGIGVNADPAKAAEFQQLASQHAATVEGFGGKDLAFAAFAEACTRGDGLGCFDAGWYRARGEEVEENLTIARELYAMACGQGVKAACARAQQLDKAQPR